MIPLRTIMAALIWCGISFPAAAQVPAIDEPDTSKLSWVENRIPDTEPEVVVYYFHRTVRCQTCLEMEFLAGEALKDRFEPELATGLLAWRPINIDRSENTSLTERFGIDGPTLIIDGGDEPGWKNLDRIWELSSDPVRYRAYVGQALQAVITPGESPEQE